MDFPQRVYATEIRAEWQTPEAGALPAIRRRPAVLHGLQDGSVYQFCDGSYFVEEFQYTAGGEGELQNSHRQSSASGEDLRFPFRETVG